MIREDKDSQEQHISVSSEEQHIAVCSEEETEQEESLNGEIETEKFCLPDCHFDGGDESSEQVINCNICGGWCHFTCVDLTPEKAEQLAFWRCDIFMPNLKQDLKKIQDLWSKRFMHGPLTSKFLVQPSSAECGGLETG